MISMVTKFTDWLFQLLNRFSWCQFFIYCFEFFQLHNKYYFGEDIVLSQKTLKEKVMILLITNGVPWTIWKKTDS